MNILVSGVNGAGKTTLCKKLKKKYPELIDTHFSNPKDMEDGKKQYFDFVEQMDNDKSYLFDRFHDGEWIYAPIFRGYEGDYLLEFENKLYDLEYVPFFVYVFAKIKDITSRIEKRGEDFVMPEHYPIERLNFDNFVAKQHLPYCTINTSRLFYGKAFQKVLRCIKKYESIRKLVNGWDKIPRGDINANELYVVKDDDFSTKITRPDIIGRNIWITIDRDVEEQSKIIKPQRIVRME